MTLLNLLPRVDDEQSADYAYRTLKHSVLTLELEPGSLVTEMSVAALLEISRTPVREALLRLSTENLLTMLPRRGATVTNLTLRQLHELAETRELLEVFAAEQICTRKLNLDSLTHWIDLQRDISEQKVVNEFQLLQIDREFHQAIVAAAGNTEILNLYKSFGDRQLRTGMALYRAQPSRISASPANHQLIADALRSYDLELATARIHDHLFDEIDGLDAIFTD